MIVNVREHYNCLVKCVCVCLDIVFTSLFLVCVCVLQYVCVCVCTIICLSCLCLNATQVPYHLTLSLFPPPPPPQNMLATGVCGWMCDFGETAPLSARLWSSTDPHSYHSLYPEVWGQLNRDAIRHGNRLRGRVCDSDDVVFFMRSGNSKGPGSTPLFWLGDQTVTWDSDDGLGTAIIGMLTEGLSGYSLTHSDIGGYTAIDYGPLQ